MAMKEVNIKTIYIGSVGSPAPPLAPYISFMLVMRYVCQSVDTESPLAWMNCNVCTC